MGNVIGNPPGAATASVPMGGRAISHAKKSTDRTPAAALASPAGPHRPTLPTVLDIDIRRELDRGLRLKHEGDDTALVRHEFGVDSGGRRVDVVLINGRLDGWEIKSDHDSLARLAGQVESFSRVLDRSWLVTTDRHLERASERLPAWWGLVRACPLGEDGQVRLTQLRRPRRSPMLDAMATAQLLWRDEAMAILVEHGLGAGLSGKARWYVWDRLAASFALDPLRGLVRDALRARPEWPGGGLPS